MAKPKRNALSLVTREGIMTLGAAVVLSHQKMHREYPRYWPAKKFQFGLLEELRGMHLAFYGSPDDEGLLLDRWEERKALAAEVSIRSFRFSWDHLYRFKILGPYLRDNLPWCETVFDGRQPIAEMRPDERPVKDLGELFQYLAQRLYEGDELNPEPRADEEILFALTMSDLTLSAPAPGRPKGSGHDEQDEPVIQHALALHSSGLIVAEAVREALKEAPQLPGSSEMQIERRIRTKVDNRLKSASHQLRSFG